MKKTKVFLLLMTMAVMVAMAPLPCYAEAAGTQPAAVDLTPLFQALIALLAAVVTVKVVPWIKSKTTTEQQARLLATVKTLVFAAEQMYGAGQGEKKLAWVEATLMAQGYSLNTELIKEAIEAQVQELTIAQGTTLTAELTGTLAVPAESAAAQT